ncbi:cell division protein FtsQ/DivIB [Celeribacter sp.]|uniref:cell division protein FtsQ/DivIB n=1 Tax=Celeribacter sp. TaxID=1890673 RepID=UPI003A91ACD8
MQPVSPSQFRAAPPPTPRAPVTGGSARVSEAVARAIGARKQTAENAAPRDPAPSRAAYRMNRLWLTPSFRFFMRRVAPALFIAGLVAIWFADDENRLAVTDTYAELKREIQNRPEFMVKLMAIDGASEEVALDIREIVPVDFPISSFDLDLNGMLAEIESLDAVEKAGLRVRAGGILQVDITERTPAVVWRGPHGLEMLDPKGHRVGALDSRLSRADLPLIAGEGADKVVGEALAIFKQAQPIVTRVRGLVRIGERRWNLVLDRGQTVMLPEKNPLGAVAQVIALNQAQDLLDRDITHVDMRHPGRPTIRLSEAAHEELRRIKGLELGVSFR